MILMPANDVSVVSFLCMASARAGAFGRGKHAKKSVRLETRYLQLRWWMSSWDLLLILGTSFRCTGSGIPWQLK